MGDRRTAGTASFLARSRRHSWSASSSGLDAGVARAVWPIGDGIVRIVRGRMSSRKRDGLRRPREREVRSGAGDAHVEQPPLLGHLLVRLGLADGQQALLHRRQEDRVPFEPLRPVVGQQVDADAVRGRLGRVASVELGQQLGRAGGSFTQTRSEAMVSSSSSDAARSPASSPAVSAPAS